MDYWQQCWAKTIVVQARKTSINCKGRYKTKESDALFMVWLEGMVYYMSSGDFWWFTLLFHNKRFGNPTFAVF